MYAGEHGRRAVGAAVARLTVAAVVGVALAVPHAGARGHGAAGKETRRQALRHRMGGGTAAASHDPTGCCGGGAWREARQAAPVSRA